jgi:hypothetical protein
MPLARRGAHKTSRTPASTSTPIAKSLNDLLRLTAQRRKSTNGFEGQNHKNEKEGATALKEKKALVAGIERFCETTMVGGSQYSVIKTEFEAKWGCQSSTGYQRRPK